MKVFLSWSGQRSRMLASALRDWLPGVLQSLEPWLSSEDMPLGTRWASDVANILQNVDVGILCLTSENLSSPWLLYEAGALSKQIKGSLVCPYLLDVSPVDIQGPLTQFQCARANREDTYKLLVALNATGHDRPLPEALLQRVFDLQWPLLAERISAIPGLVQPAVREPTTMDEKLDEILAILKRTEPVDSESPKSAIGDTPQSNSALSADRPRIFIGSSSEGLSVAEAIQLGLDTAAECTIWNQSIFAVSTTAIENLVDIGREFDGAVLVLTPDDMLVKRGASGAAPRDNIIFEAGLFTGMLGRARTFLVLPRDAQLTLPSDLSGVTAATYAARSDGNLHAALGPVCTRIKRALGLP